MWFIESTVYEVADIKMGFYSNDHDNNKPFDGVLRILAYAFLLESDSLHLDVASDGQWISRKRSYKWQWTY